MHGNSEFKKVMKREREDIKKKAHLQSNIGGGVERGFIDRVLMFQSQ